MILPKCPTCHQYSRWNCLVCYAWLVTTGKFCAINYKLWRKSAN